MISLFNRIEKKEDNKSLDTNNFETNVMLNDEQIENTNKLIDEIDKYNRSIDEIVNNELMVLLLEQAQKTESAIGAVHEYMDILNNLVEDELNIISEFSKTVENLNMCSNSLNNNTISINEIVSVLEDLKGEGYRIQEESKTAIMIVDNIKDLNSRTNLLSLNASIEAARAGESGKGFIVVSSEMRKLSDATKISVDNIKGNTEKYINGIESLIHRIDLCNSVVKEKTVDIFTVQEGVKENIERIINIFEGLTDMRDKLNEEVQKGKETYTKLSTLSNTFDTMCEIAMKISECNMEQKKCIDEVVMKNQSKEKEV